MQRNSSTYCDEPEDRADYEAWLAGFDLGAKTGDIDEIVRSNAFMAELQARIVPLIVQYDAFWTRYFYQCAPRLFPTLCLPCPSCMYGPAVRQRNTVSVTDRHPVKDSSGPLSWAPTCRSISSIGRGVASAGSRGPCACDATRSPTRKTRCEKQPSVCDCAQAAQAAGEGRAAAEGGPHGRARLRGATTSLPRPGTTTAAARPQRARGATSASATPQPSSQPSPARGPRPPLRRAQGGWFQFIDSATPLL